MEYKKLILKERVTFSRKLKQVVNDDEMTRKKDNMKMMTKNEIIPPHTYDVISCSDLVYIDFDFGRDLRQTVTSCNTLFSQ